MNNNVFSSSDLDCSVDDLPINQGGLVSVTMIKGVIAAIIGAIPGVLLWILLGAFNYIAAVSGLVLALGVIGAYEFATGFATAKGKLSPVFSIAVCGVVIVIAVYFAEKYVYAGHLYDALLEYKGEWTSTFDSLTNEYGLSEEDIRELGVSVTYEDWLFETFGFRQLSVGNCFSNFWTILDEIELKGRFFKSICLSYILAAIGGVSTFAKMYT